MLTILSTRNIGNKQNVKCMVRSTVIINQGLTIRHQYFKNNTEFITGRRDTTTYDDPEKAETEPTEAIRARVENFILFYFYLVYLQKDIKLWGHDDKFESVAFFKIASWFVGYLRNFSCTDVLSNYAWRAADCTSYYFPRFDEIPFRKVETIVIILVV